MRDAIPGTTSNGAARADSQPLNGARICLVFEHSLSHYTRILEEIHVLRAAGAEVRLLTSFANDEALPKGLLKTVAPLEMRYSIPASELSWRVFRIIDNLGRRVVRRLTAPLQRKWATSDRMRALESIEPEVDLFWVVDFPSLPTSLAVGRKTGTRVLYETVDLVPEYPYRGERHRAQMLELERRLIGDVDGFITCCDSYADYYVEKYGDIGLARPVVRSDMPDHTVNTPRPTSRPLKLLFLGSLMFDRPVEELIRAMALTKQDVRLTFQGKNYVGDGPAGLVRDLELGDRVSILDPCPPDAIVETASAYDIGIVALRGLNENERRASTTKLFTYMSAGLAVLGSDLPGIARVVNEYRNGVLVRSMDSRVWADAIDQMAAMSDAELDAMRLRSLNGAREHSLDRQSPAYIAEFKRALAGT